MDIVCALRSFLRVAEAGSFSAAAVDLELTQPAVSRHVSALETHLKIRLLHRSTAALALTAEGEQMIPMAQKVIEAVEALGDTAHSTGRVSGKVRLSVPAPLGCYLSDRLATFLSTYSDLCVELLFREEPSDLVEDGIDFEVRLGAVSDRSLICRRIGWTTAFLVAAPAYLERRAPIRALEDLREHDCISYSRGGDSRSWSFVQGSDEVAVRIAPRLVFNNAVAAQRAAISGAGIAVLSHLLAGPEMKAGQFVSLLPEFPPARLPINLTYSSRRNMPLRVRATIDYLVAVMQEDPYMAA